MHRRAIPWHRSRATLFSRAHAAEHILRRVGLGGWHHNGRPPRSVRQRVVARFKLCMSLRFWRANASRDICACSYYCWLSDEFLEHSGRVMTIPIAGMIFCGVAFLFFLAWHFAAPLPPPKIAQESLDQSNVPASSEQPSYAGSLRRMSPAKLREHVDDFGRELRTFENGFKDQYMKFILEGQQRRAEAKTEEEKQRMWTADSNQTILMSQRHNQEFQARFRGRGLAIQAELERRLETRISGNDREGAPLTLGMLAGPSPLADLAAWLSDYARQVPDE